MMIQEKNKQILSDAVWGFVMGDALGVPVEFESREFLQKKPVQELTGWGSHHQPPGTWSDDTSMMLCTLECLKKGGSMTDLANLFLSWYKDGYLAAHDELFDIGITTRLAMERLQEGDPWFQSGNSEERSACGNGSLMRILPYAFFDSYIQADTPIRFSQISKAGSITHAHAIPHFCSFLYVEWIKELIIGRSLLEALTAAREHTVTAMDQDPNKELVTNKMQQLLEADFSSIPVTKIKSGGYVVHTLEAVIWSALLGTDFRSTVLNAINLGEDTDTVGALTGAVAAILYGPDLEWKQGLIATEKIERILSF